MDQQAKTSAQFPLAEERECVRKAERLVVKVGTNLLTDGAQGVNRRYVADLARALSELWSCGKKVLLVTSGAIGAGVKRLNCPKRPTEIPALQALAAVGQVELMRLYAQAFSRCRPALPVAQLLLTRDGLENRQRYLNAKNTIEELWQRGVLPIVNENDTVSVEEICFGNNDLLSVLVADAADADLLLLLTVVPGLLEPAEKGGDVLGPNARVVPTVEKISSAVEKLAQPIKSSLGTGGMLGKLDAAKLATASGLPLILCDGRQPKLLLAAAAGRRIGTFFPSTGRRLAARKRWRVFTAKPAGRLVLDAGACEALIRRSKSLLPSGISAVNGNFPAGAVVSLCNSIDEEIARGVVFYSADDIRKIRGCGSKEIARLLGSMSHEEVIHRDNLVIF
jgi:glutamate 5-kinase